MALEYTIIPQDSVVVEVLEGAPGLAGIFVVEHGTDPNVVRPPHPIIYWIGTAEPVNAQPWDFRSDS